MKAETKETFKKLADTLRRNRYVALVLLAGLALMLIPTGRDGGEEKPATAPAEDTKDGVSELEGRLEEMLSLIDGAGEVRVMLTLASDGERVLARDTEKTAESRNGEERLSSSDSAILVQRGSGQSGEVEVKYLYPEYRGAVIAAQGAGSAQVRTAILNAVKAATGLGGEAIEIVKMR